MNTLRLDGEFPTVTQEEWLKSVEAVLKGADFEKILVSKTYDDIAIQPLYRRVSDTTAEGRRAGASPWSVIQRIDHTDIAAANAQIHDDLAGGTDGFVLVGADAKAARGFGLRLDKPEDMEALLKDVDIGTLKLRFDAGNKSLQWAKSLFSFAEQKKLPTSHLSLDIGCDPLGTLAGRGYTDEAPEQIMHACADIFGSAATRGFKARIFLADGRPYHEAGASEAQELAAVLSTGLFYLRYLVNLGIDFEAARDALSFLLVADTDEFLTVAKFRALRRLWRKVEETCGLAPKPILIHAETAWRMMSRYDSWTNLLRCTTAVFSAGVGGADAISVLPFTNAIGLPDAIARRTARNIQLVLINESNLWRVTDPAAGAGSFEALTDELCQKAWKLFQRIEREGGITSSLEQGLLQARIADSQVRRQRDIATKKRPITGISEFPDIHAEPVAVLAAIPDQPANAPKERAASVQPLVAHRDAEAFELLRDRMEKHAKASGKREKIFIATVGSPAAFSGRATFARNFFEVAGLEAVMPESVLTPESVAAEFRKSGARIACLASSDDGYAEGAKQTSEALAKTSCKLAFIVCRSGIDPAWEVTGISEAVTPRVDALAVLERAVNAVLPAATSSADH